MGRLFVSAREYDNLRGFNGERFGKTWTVEEVEHLNKLFSQGLGLSNICKLLQRPAAGVLAKLENLVDRDDSGGYWYRYDNTVKPTETTKEQTMSTNTTSPVVKTQTLIAGQDAANLSDGEIFRLIAKIEGEITSLSSIKAKSNKLAAAIKAKEKDISDLVAVVDGRE